MSEAITNLDLAPIASGSEGAQAIPLIDLSAGIGPVVDEIGNACAQWGFFQVVGHRLDPALVASAMAQTRAFFALPQATKRLYSRSRDNPWGYYDRELTKTVRDKKEIFDVGPEIFTDGPFDGSTPWPTEQPGLRPILRAYFDACETLSERLLDAVTESFGAPNGKLHDAFSPDHTSFLRLNHYPVADPLGDRASDVADLGIHHHSDAGALTLLLQDNVSGLQVYRQGAWYDVMPVLGALVVNIGDMVQVWSNDLYRAPIHRVLGMDSDERFSLPFFYNPSYDAVVAPLDSALSKSGARRYRGISWGEFRRRRADGDFADYGTEVQISDYRIETPKSD
jgi:isopenicillin N synthase-like dioxygenase